MLIVCLMLSVLFIFLILLSYCWEAQVIAILFSPQELRQHEEKKKRSRDEAEDGDDAEGTMGVRNKVAGGKKKKWKAWQFFVLLGFLDSGKLWSSAIIRLALHH